MQTGEGIPASQPQEARGRHLLRGPAASMAWPLAGWVRARQGFSAAILPLDRVLERRRKFVVFEAHPFQFDKLSDIVKERHRAQETYAATFRVASDHSIPSEVLEAVQHNHYPQFNLRNIGRVEKTDVDPEEPLPLDRRSGVSGSAADDLFEEVRTARMPEIRYADVWSERMMAAVRASFRRLLVEDPWEQRFGAEAKANYEGPVHRFIVEGTHPDDLPGAWWGPETIRGPAVRAKPTGHERGEQATSIYDVIRVVSGGND